MYRIKFKTLLIGFVLNAASPAHDPITTQLTWTREISRLVYQHCAACHRPGGRAMSLLTYEEARPWAKAMRDEVANRRMPPWDAMKGVGQFRDDASLSPAQIELLVNWVEGGAPEGNPIYLPPTPPPAPATVTAPTGKGITLRDSAILAVPLKLTAIRPEGPVELSAILPGGAVHHLLWIPVFRPEWNRTYRLRTPLKLPRGTKMVLSGGSVELM